MELNASSTLQITEVIRLRLNNLLHITSSMVANDDTNEEYLRICAPCARFLQRNYDKIRFRNMEKDELFYHHEVRNGIDYLLVNREELVSSRN